MLQVLQSHILKSVPQLKDSIGAIMPHFSLQEFKKDEELLVENVPCERLFFVCKGMLHLYYAHSGENHTIHFALENWWLTDYKTFPDTNPAMLCIAAVEDTTVAIIGKADYDALLLAHPLLAVYFNNIHQRAYGAALYKQRTFATTPKEDFYRYFRNTYPDLIRRIPDPIFASYMGVSLATLEKIREQSIS